MGGSPYGRLNYRSRPLRLSRLSAITFLFQPRQFDRELTSRSGTAVHQHPATVRERDLLHEVEADPHPDQVAVGLGLDPSKALEELTLILRLDPEPVIEDANPPVAIIDLGQADVDPPAGAGPEAYGIVQQLPQGQVQPVGIAADHGVVGVEAEVDGQVGKAALLIFDHGLHQPDQVDRLSRHRRPQLVEAADQAHIHDQAAELARLLVNARPGQLLVLGTQPTLGRHRAAAEQHARGTPQYVRRQIQSHSPAAVRPHTPHDYAG